MHVWTPPKDDPTGCRLSAAVLDGTGGGEVLYAADVAPVAGLEGVQEVSLGLRMHACMHASLQGTRPHDSQTLHQVSFTPTISGAYALALGFEDGRALQGSPFAVRVKTDETAAGNCKLYGAGLTQAVAGEPTSFQIQGRALLAG